MKNWFSAAFLAREKLPGLPSTERRIRDALERRVENKPELRRKREFGKGSEYHFDSLPIETQAELAKRFPSPQALPPAVSPDAPQRGTSAAPLSPSPASAATYSYDAEALWAWAERKSQTSRDAGASRAQMLHQVMRLKDSGRTFRSAAEIVATANGISPANLRNWYYGANGKPGAQDYHPSDWAAALIPGYCGRTATSECSPEAWDYFKADFLRNEKPASTACYDRLKRAAAAQGWTVPSIATLTRRLERELSRAAVILARGGVEALKRSYPAQERDRSVFHALEAVNADGHKFDVFVKWPDGHIERPVMVAWQDIYSGKLLSYRIDHTENTDAVRLSFGEVVEKYGIPLHSYLDNGRAFASKWMTGGIPNRYRFKVREEEPAGILTVLGVEVHWATPYHGQAKPIERAFKDLCEYVARHPAFAGAYTGNNPNAKPENYGNTAIALGDFLAVLDTEIAAHNARPGRRASVCNGRSFDAAFAESYERSPIRKATAEQRRLWLLAAEGVNVRRDGSITLAAERDNRYWAAALHDLAGHNIIARFDPQSLHDLVHCYTMDGRYLGEAQCVQAVGFNDTQAAREHSRARNKFKRAAKDQLNAENRMTALEASKFIPAATQADVPDSRVVRPAFTLRTQPQATPLTAQQQEAHARVVADLSAPQERQLPETVRQKFQRWVRLSRRIAERDALSEEEIEWYANFKRTSEFHLEADIHADFGLLVDDLPVEISKEEMKKESPHERATT